MAVEIGREALGSGRLRIALAEDEELYREAVKEALEDEGFEVIAFEDGFELLDYLEMIGGHALGASWPDAIVTDFSMPGRTGLDAAEVARRMGADTPVFVVTGMPGAAVQAQAAALGNAKVFAKSLDIGHLVRAIRRSLEGPGRASGTECTLAG
jgi:CheY-like chemotaxis protein